MNMGALASGSFDAAYQIEATCHAPDIRGVYSEIFRVLKPGGVFGSYEWCLTDKYNEGNAEHRQCKHDILLGNGLPDLRSSRECLQALKDVGFEVEAEFDLGDQGDIPWYDSLDATRWFSLRNFRVSGFGRSVTHAAVWLLETLRIAPAGTCAVSAFLVKGADALVAGGRKEARSGGGPCAQTGRALAKCVRATHCGPALTRACCAAARRAQIFTPMYFTLARKPLPKGKAGKGGAGAAAGGAPSRSRATPATSAATGATVDGDEEDDA
jgi:hypothetical protein